MGDLGSIPRLGRSPGDGKGYPLQDSGLENSMDYIVHGFATSQTFIFRNKKGENGEIHNLLLLGMREGL